MKSVIIGSFLAAIALFFWGFIYFGISTLPYRLLDDAGEFGPTVASQFSDTGTFLYPDPRLELPAEAMAKAPFLLVHYVKPGDFNTGGMMLGGFVHGWIYCALLAALLSQICKKSGYGARVGFVTLVGFSGAFASRIGDAIWWHKTWAWQLSDLAYATIGAALAGLVLARFIKSHVRD